MKKSKIVDHIAEKEAKKREYAEMWGGTYECVPEREQMFNPEYGKVSDGLTKKC